MIVHCIVERGEGNREAVVNLDRFVYRFKPQVELTGNDKDMVAEVTSRSHQEYLLGLDGFREWEPVGPAEFVETTESTVAQESTEPAIKRRRRKRN